MASTTENAHQHHPGHAKRPHALVLSFPRQGHMNPLIQISRKLASQGFAITFVVPEQSNAHKKEAQQGSETTTTSEADNPQKRDIRFVGVPSGLPEERSGLTEFRDCIEATVNMRDGVEQLIQRVLQEDDDPFTFVLTDVFVIWAHEVASKFGIPHIAFFTASATCCCIFVHAQALKSKGILPLRDENDEFIRKDLVTCIPGVAPLHPRDFPRCLTYCASHFRFQFILNQSENFRTASGIIMNTYEELEFSAVAALRTNVPVYPVGPLLLLCGEGANRSRVEVNYWQEHYECLHWLDTQATASVLYVSFGSVATLPVSHMKELALGLEASQQPFLWVIRDDSVVGSVSDVLPEGFLSRTKDGGLIISWAPQLLVLDHPAVGGFLTHCGWNSITENINTGSVPMICWPHAAEQRLNCRLMVDQWKIAMKFEREEDEMVEKDEVERVVRAVLQGQEGREMRARAIEMREAGRKAVEEGGSSYRNLQAFVEATAAFGVGTPS